MDSKLQFCETNTNSQNTNYEFPHYTLSSVPLHRRNPLFIFAVQIRCLAIVASDGATVAATVFHPNIDARM